jgi:hypothetical protein
LDRYRPTWEKDPFQRTTVAPAAPAVASQLAIAAISRIGDDVTVLVVDKRTRAYQKLTREPNAAGLRVVQILPHADRREARVRISDGARETLLAYDAPRGESSAPAGTSAPSAPETAGTARPVPDPPAEGENPPKVRLKLRLPANGPPTE